MITPAYCQTMARYNQWMNNKLIAACQSLSAVELEADKGAFFGSIMNTLEHLYFCDGTILEVLSGKQIENVGFGVRKFDTLESYAFARIERDQRLIDWADKLSEQDLTGDVDYGCPTRLLPESMQATIDSDLYSMGVYPRQKIVLHLFNHQTHHRGQVSTLLTQAGATVGDTDLWMLP